LASDPPISAIKIPILIWTRVLADLRQRGGGKGESGAFLLGRQRGTRGRVASYICYDDLDPSAQQRGAIAFHAAGYAALWKLCRERQLQVLADVHTHPTADVRQSGIDQRHPMVPVADHTAMIVPNFGATDWWSLKQVGVYQYLGNFQWRAHGADERPRRVQLSLW
jgi:proteasome lid subunit RPN8/RPN11